MIGFKPALQLMRAHRPLPILLILWPTYWGLFLTKTPSFGIVVVFTLGVLLMRAAGCVINDYFDRHFDPQIHRTKTRPLAKGSATPKQALSLFASLILTATCLLFFLHPITIFLAFIALILAITYPLAKRFTYFPQFILGCAFNFGLIMAYVQVNGHTSSAMFFWYVFAIIWTLLYDTEYALADYQDDLKIGIKSTTTFFGSNIMLFLAFLSALLITMLIIAFIFSNHHTVLHALITITLSLFLIWQMILLKQSPVNQGSRLFNLHHWLGFGLFLLIIFRA